METLPVDMIHEICKYLNVHSVCCVGAVNRYLHDTVDGTYKESKQLLNTKKHRSNTLNRQQLSNEQFHYADSLTTHKQKEYWAKIANNTNNYNLFRNVHQSLKRVSYDYSSEHEMTMEQLDIVCTPPTMTTNLLVQAYAGTGKTTTLFEYAKRWSTKSILYLAYNTSLSKETATKFIGCSNVNVFTINSFIFRQLDKKKMDIDEITPNDVMEYLELDEYASKKILESFKRYCSSDSLEPPNETGVGELWNAMFVENKLKVTHEGYVKYYQMQQHKHIDYDIIMIDEVQDCTDCVLSIVCNLNNITKIFVGDSYQQLYGFNHVNNPYEYISGKLELSRKTLTTSFRFSYNLMYLCNRFLNSKFLVKGFRRSKKELEYTQVYNQHELYGDDFQIRYDLLPTNTTIVCRYNVTLLSTMFDMGTRNIKYNTHQKEIDFDHEMDIVNEIMNINNMDYKKNTIVDKFKSVNDLSVYVSKMNLSEWKTRLRLYSVHGNSMIHLWESAKRSYTRSDGYTLITAHQSKGLEFDNVLIANDFTFNNTDACYVMYVAMSRAKRKLYINNLLNAYMYTKHCKFSIMSNNPKRSTYGRCHKCGTKFTDQSVFVEQDQEVVTRYTCNMFVIENMCTQCKKNDGII